MESANSDAIKKLAAESGVTATAANGGVAAVDAIGRWLIEKKRRKELPRLIEEMQEPVEAACKLLTADFGELDAQGHGRGLRHALWISYTDLIDNQQVYIANARRTHGLTASEEAVEIRKIPALIRERKQADQTLVQTVLSLRQMVKANAELQAAVKSKRDIRSATDALYQEGQRIHDFYQALAKAQ
jgi:hypothetical protein